MSNWTTDSAANRTKKSYFNGFIDMSGGELTVRHRGATFGGDVSFGTGVDISGDISTRGDADIGGTLTVTEDLSAHALVAAQQLTVAGDASFAGVRVDGNLNVGGSITSGGGTLELQGLTLTGDLSAHALISTANLDVVSDASFQSNVYVNGDLDVDGSLNGTDASFGGSLIVHGAGMFTGSTDINRTTAPSGVYLGNNGSVGSQDSIIQMTSDGNYSVIDFTSSGATGNNQDFEGRIIYHNSNHPSASYRLHLIPKGADYKGLRLDPASGNVVSATVEGHLKVDDHADIDGTLTVDGTSTMNSTLAIVEAAAGTAASATGGSITLSHATSDGTGKNSIVFKSASDSGSDFGYIQYEDHDGSDGSSENGLLTIGVQNDAIDWGQGITHADKIKFDIAGASAYLQGRANSTGGNLASLLSVGSGYFTGIYSDAFDISDAWNQGALDDYSSTSLQDRYALYQYFDNADNSTQDMALVGFNGGSDGAVDGSKPYGYMYRCSRSPNRFIAFQTLGLEGAIDSRGMKLGVSAYPGINYEFAVGGKSHLGNDVDISGDLTVEGAGIFTGVSTGYNSTTSPSGIYIGNYVSGSDEYANMQIVSNNSEKKSWIDFTNTGVSTSYADHEGRIAYHGEGGSTHSKLFLFYPHGHTGGSLKLQSLGSSAADATVDGMLTLQGGAPAHVRDYESVDYWNAVLNCSNDYRSSWSDARSAAYLYVNNGYDDNADLLLTGHLNSTKTIGYNLYSKGAVQAGVTDQGLCIQTYYSFSDPSQCFRIGLGDRPSFHQFLTTGDVRVGGNLDLCGNLTVAGFLQYGTIETSTLTSAGNLTIQPTGKVHITRSLQVDGSINFNGDFIKTDALISMTEPLDISNDDTVSAMIVRQLGSQPVAEFYDDNALAMRIDDGGIVTIPNDVLIDGNLNLDTIVKTGSTITGTPPTSLDGGIFRVISTATPNVYTEPFNDITSGCPARIALYVDVSTNPDVKTPSLHLVKISQQDNDNDFNKGLFTEFWQSGANLNKAVCEFDVGSKLTTNTSGRASFEALLLNAHGGSNNETDTAFTVKSERRVEQNSIIHRLNWFGIKSEMLLNYSSVSTKPVVLSKSYNDQTSGLSNDSTGLFRVDSSYTPTATDPSFAYNAIPGDFSAGVYVGTHRYTENTSLVTSAEINMVSYTNFEYSGNYFTFWTPRAEHGLGRFAARFISGCDPGGSGDRSFTLQMTNRVGDVKYDMMVCEIDGNDSNHKITFDCSLYAPDFIESSDLRLKTDIETIENALDKVCRLRGVSYRLKENYDPESTKSLGMIAQEMEQEFPELVSENRGYKNINYYNFTATLLDSAKELKARNDALEAKHAAWEARIKDLEAELVSMDTALQALEVA